jgi:hypothetical protein
MEENNQYNQSRGQAQKNLCSKLKKWSKVANLN